MQNFFDRIAALAARRRSSASSSGSSSLLAGGYWYFFYSDMQDEQAQLEQDKTRLEKEKQEYEKRKQEYLAFRNEVNALLEEQKELLRVLPKADDIEQFIENVQAQIELAGLSKVESVREPAQPVEMYVKIPIKMSLTGQLPSDQSLLQAGRRAQAHRQHRGLVARAVSLSGRARAAEPAQGELHGDDVHVHRQGRRRAEEERHVNHLGRWPLIARRWWLGAVDAGGVRRRAPIARRRRRTSRRRRPRIRRRRRDRRWRRCSRASSSPRRRCCRKCASGQLTNEDFKESPTNRDPFRSFLTTFAAQVVNVKPQHRILLEKFALEELQLIAIVGGNGTQPKAMFVDPTGTGHDGGARRSRFEVGCAGDARGAGPRVLPGRRGPGRRVENRSWSNA